MFIAFRLTNFAVNFRLQMWPVY